MSNDYIFIIAQPNVIAIELAIMDNAVVGVLQKVIICDLENINSCAGVLEPFVNTPLYSSGTILVGKEN